MTILPFRRSATLMEPGAYQRSMLRELLPWRLVKDLPERPNPHGDPGHEAWKCAQTKLLIAGALREGPPALDRAALNRAFECEDTMLSAFRSVRDGRRRKGEII